MKKFIFTAVTVFVLGFSANATSIQPVKVPSPASSYLTANSIDEMFIKIRIHIDFGRKSKGCAGFGVCSATIEAEIESPISFELSANTEQQATLEMNAAAYEKVVKTFGGPAIIVDEDYQLDKTLTDRAGLKAGYTIKAGKYYVTKNSVTGNYQTVL